MDIANIDKFEKAPPDIVSIKLVSDMVEDFIVSAKANVSTPGTVIKQPKRNSTINNNVYPNLLRTSGVLKAFFIV